MIIAIDGPSGAGKSSVSKAVAHRLGFSCLDTGAMYRAVAWRVLHDGVALNSAKEIEQIACAHNISFEHEPGNPIPQRVFIDDIDVTSAIRTAEVDKAVSVVSALPLVREALVEQQRRITRGGNYVVEGRDIGTTVFPAAELKIFLTASPEERARRRVIQNVERGVGCVDYDEVLAGIKCRDVLDSSRATSPLKPAADAFHFDSTDCPVEEVIDQICTLAREHGAYKSEDVVL